MPCVAEVVKRSLKADCTDFTMEEAAKVCNDSPFKNSYNCSDKHGT